MFLIVLRAIYFVVCCSAIAAFVHPKNEPPAIVENHEIVAFLLILLVTQLGTLVDVFIPKKRVEVISAVYFGLLIGVLLSYLMSQAISPVFAAMKSMASYRDAVVMVLTLMITYFSTSLLVQTRDDFRFVIPYVEFSRELKGVRPLILDSSALIDGRIADVVETKILDSKMVVPDFVLKEV
ncbi:MAG: PilT protein domain-containing protein, partial [Planctomycetota bacterium]